MPPGSLMPLPLFESPNISDHFQPEAQIVVHQGDIANFIQSLPTASVQLIVTSPPYNIGKQYETRQAIEVYLEQQDSVVDELVRVLAPTGSICWQVGNYVEDAEVFPLDIFFYSLFKKRGLKLRNRIIWHFEHGLHASKRLSGRYETVLWFTKGDEYTFNLDPIRVPSKYPGKRHFKGPNIGKPSGNPLGKNPSDLWEFVAQEWDIQIWDIPNVKANHPEKTDHPCQFPIELVERCVLALTNEDDWILDPYCGVGSSLIAGIKHQRRVIGCDKEAEYVAIAQQRIADFHSGRLKMRPLGKPVHSPVRSRKGGASPGGMEGESAMKIAGVYSFNNGQPFITEHYPHLLAEIHQTIEAVDASTYHTKVSREKTMTGKMLYNPRALNSGFAQQLKPRGWQTVRVRSDYSSAFYTADYSPKRLNKGAFRELDFLKEKLGSRSSSESTPSWSTTSALR